MTDTPPAVPCEMAQRVAEVATKLVARSWWYECQKIAEQVDDPPARWAILVKALRKRGWPDGGVP